MKINATIEVQTVYAGKQSINRVELFTELDMNGQHILYKLLGWLGQYQYPIDYFDDLSDAMKAFVFLTKKLLREQTKEAKQRMQ